VQLFRRCVVNQLVRAVVASYIARAVEGTVGFLLPPYRQPVAPLACTS